MMMQKLDGIFNGEDVIGLVLIHFVEDGSEGRRLAGARRAGYQDNAVAQFHNFPQHVRQMHLLEAGNLVWDYAHHYSAATPLPENVDAETRHALNTVGKIGGTILLELADGRLVFSHDVVGDVHGVLRSQRLETLVLKLYQLAAYFDLRSAAGGENQVADVQAGLEHGR